jgi:hypothetical protein
MRGIRDKFPTANRGDKFRFVGLWVFLTPPYGHPSHEGKKELIPLYKQG